VYNQSNHKNILQHTPTTRVLCECEIYMPNYDNDTKMKKVMDNFNKQTQQRLREYDERLQSKRMQCKEQCDKEIQKIILKDKLDKELTEKFATLHTDIQNDAIPTCICEKSMADIVEKTCLKCTQNLGGIVAPSSGVLLGIAEGALYAWKDAAIIAAKAAAVTEGAAKGLAAGAEVGKDAVILGLNSEFGLSTQAVQKIALVINGTNYKDVSFIYQAVYTTFQRSCFPTAHVSGDVSVRFTAATTDQAFCRTVNALGFARGNVFDPSLLQGSIQKAVKKIVTEATTVASKTGEKATEKLTVAAIQSKTAAVDATYMGYQTPIIASVVAIL
ncbi:surface antigen, partial [Plasmodium falciparum UGT5.1]